MSTNTQTNTEEVNSAARQIDRLNTLEMVQLINAEDAKVAEAVKSQLPKIAAAIDIIVARLREGGRLIYMGAGTSGRLGVLDASECPPTFNTPPEMVVARIAGGELAMTQSIEEVEDKPELGRADAIGLGLSKADVLVGIAASGSTPYVMGAVAYAHDVGAFTIGLVCNSNTPLEQVVEIAITPVVGPEIVNGSTRMKAGTAQKMVLNMLTTGTMIKLGRTFGNLMVDVRPINAKLRRRAVRIVQEATGLDEITAEDLLHACNDETKTAIVAALAHLDPAQARQRLQIAGGIVRNALEIPT